ncbi:hypothetical protein RND71_018526 [Anisodus tanguticus]|uniref:HIG1 domain-containing protein n=1 Tax=Anisodus tanguticus TaxID=243964 RepID=A0AAE1S4D4_9SOLA|nr:hypothetical protein RND71_018526 [Anisodus tanguticus]
MEGLQSWVSEHKLSSIGTLWATAVGASLAYSSQVLGSSMPVRTMGNRMHAQSLTLAVLSGAAVYHYYDKNSNDQLHK